MEPSSSEKMGQLIAKVEAAHGRIDKLELGIRDDLKDIKKEIQELSAHMNRSKGWAAAVIILSGVVGAAVTALLKFAVLAKGG